MMETCKNCGVSWYPDFQTSHACKPEWQAINAWNLVSDKPERAFGRDAEEAALEYAERNFERFEYPDELEVWVRKSGMDEWIRFSVESRPEPVFSATRIGPAKGKE